MQVPLLDLKAQYQEIREEVLAAISDVCESQHFILGAMVEKFEEKIARYSKVKHAIGVASGTDALLLALMAIGVGHGDEVVTTPYTFFATAGSISRLGARPVFVDINPKTYNMDPNRLDDYIKKRLKAKGQRLKAIIPVHLYGQCADMNPIVDIAKKYNLKVIEDAAQAIGAEYKDQKAGSIGDCGCFSFFPSKNLGGFGDGGMVITNDDDLTSRIRVLRVHGSEPKYYHKMVGCNSRLDALQAAILMVKIKYLDRWTKERQDNAERYNQLFKEADLLDKVVIPHVEPYSHHIYNQYVIRTSNRDALRVHLKKENVGTEIYYPVPLHIQECFRGLGYKTGDLPEAEKAANETIALPVYPELTEEMQRYVVEKIREFYC